MDNLEVILTISVLDNFTSTLGESKLALDALVIAIQSCKRTQLEVTLLHWHFPYVLAGFIADYCPTKWLFLL